MREARHIPRNSGSLPHRLIRSILVTLLATMVSFGGLLPVSASPITATACLTSSSGVAIPGAEASFNFGGWQSIGFTDATGCVSTDSVSAAGNRTFRIAVGGLMLNKTQNTLNNPVVVFQTTAVNIRLLDSTGANGIPGAVIEYNGGGWQTLGTTDSTGAVTAELLGVNTNFRVTQNGQTQTKSQNTGNNPNVTFQTAGVVIRLLDSTGANGIPGAVIEYNGGGWQTLGTTDSTGAVTAELLGVNTNFRVTQNGQTQTKSQNTGNNPNVTFQTGKVLQGPGPRVLAYSAQGWQTFTNGAELLPGNITFELDTGPNQIHPVVAGATVYVTTAPTAPVVAAADQTANHGEPVGLVSGSFVDQEPSQTHRATINWGDGSALDIGVVSQVDGLAGTVTGSHVFTDKGAFSVAICVSDNGDPDAEGCDTMQMTVINVAPQVIVLGLPGPGQEGSQIILSSDVFDLDPVTLSWTVTVDGETLATGTDPDLSFTPADEGVYEVSLTVDDGNGGVTTDTGQVTVSNVAPTVSVIGAPDSVVEGEEVTLSSIATDPGSTDVHTYVWTATRDAVTVATGTETAFSFTPEMAGDYVVTLIVNDGDGGIASTQVLLDVTPNPVPEPEPAPASEPEPAPASGPEPEPTPTKYEPANNKWVPPLGWSPNRDLLGWTGARDVSDLVTEPETFAAMEANVPVRSPDAASFAENYETSTNGPLTGLLVTLLLVGPALFLLARRWLRRRTV